MIDTMFFLLVFFMLSSLALVRLQGLPVNLPQASTAKKQTATDVTITTDKEQRPPRFRMDMIQVSRVLMDKSGKKTEKVVTKKEVQKKVEQVHKEIQRRKPEPKRIAQRPPQQHLRTLTAIPNKNVPPNPDDNT